MRRNKLWLLVVTLGVILLAACGPKTTPTETPSEEIFAKSSEALKGLKSYRYLCLFKFETEEAKITTGSIEIKGEYVAPDREHVTWTDLSTMEWFEVIRIGNKAWIKTGGEKWLEMPAEFVESMMQAVRLFDPVHSWDSLYMGLPGTSNLVGKEVVNGISCFHYASSYKGWGAIFGGGITEAKGDIWIAVEGFPVKYIFKASGIDAKGKRGSIEWSMELKDVNKSLSIEPPK